VHRGAHPRPGSLLQAAYARATADRTTWQLLILQDLAQRYGLRQSFLKHRLAPWVIACLYYDICWLLFLVAPEWSLRLNADFEDHAEHEYMAYVAAHTELETQPAVAARLTTGWPRIDMMGSCAESRTPEAGHRSRWSS